MLVTDTRRGGTPIRMAAVARGMRARGWDVLFACVMPAGPVLNDLAQCGMPTASLGLVSPLGGFGAIRRLRRLLREWRPDVLQTALWHANVLGRLAAVGTGVPVVDGYQSVDDEKPFVRVAVDRATHRLAARHVAVSEAVAERLRSREHIGADRIVVVPLGKRVGAFEPRGQRDEVRAALGIPTDVPVVGWVGRVHPVKDLPTLVRAVASLPGWWLLVVGDGDAMTEVRDTVASSGIANRVRFEGEQADVARYLEAMDMFALTSRWEGFPGALVEAMAAGLPVVATRVGGVPELVTDRADGLLVAPGDVVAVRAAMVEAAAWPELGEAARRTVNERFSEEAMLDGYELVWHEVAA